MSEPALNFDQAQFSQPSAGATCGQCKQPIADQYFDANGIVLCAPCKQQLEAGWKGGSPMARFGKALGLGIGGGFVGALVWFLVAKFTGYELGLIAILVGFLVGKGIAMGSEHRGGRGYQVLALAITYLSIVATYIPPIVEALDQQTAQEQQAATAEGGEVVEPLPRAIVYITASILSVGAPFLAGIENLMGLLIIAIALWEAWKLTAKRELTFGGPYTVAAAEPEPAPQLAAAGE